ncbi:MAG: PDZ domain-containing protein [Oscillospiraceae bacterium]|nr:PDZ domain-containing protein [Oscillospiraceae bacterium]
MNENNHSTDSWAQDSYETGSTNPPKSRGGLVAVLLVLVILLCGVSSYLGVLNIKLGQQLQQDRDSKVPILFLPQSTDAFDSTENVVSADGLLPGVEGRTVSEPERSFYHWPAGVVVTKVLPGSDAAKAGLTIGDIITSVNEKAVTDTQSLLSILEELQPGSKISVTFCRNGSSYHSYQCTLE